MMLLDLLILIFLGVFVFKGLKLGLIEAVGGIVGIILGIILANHYYPGVAEWLGGFVKSGLVAGVGAYILVFIVINRLVALAFLVLNKVFDLVAIIPFLKSFNHLLGAIFGFIEGVLILGIAVYLITLLPFGQKLLPSETTSKFIPKLLAVGQMISPYLPDALKQSEALWPSDLKLPAGFDLKNLPINQDLLNNLGEQGKNLLNQLPKELPKGTQ
ncbi:MAG: CvpA family protein [Candidatus Komeilibacteria bacterium]|nr:CvpA family protein [Candidatus Komeilibacteria bacterium]